MKGIFNWLYEEKEPNVMHTGGEGNSSSVYKEGGRGIDFFREKEYLCISSSILCQISCRLHSCF